MRNEALLGLPPRDRVGGRSAAVLATCLIIIGLAAGCARVHPTAKTEPATSAPSRVAEGSAPQSVSGTAVVAEATESMARSRLTGLLVPAERAERRILAIMVDNQTQARPQAGIGQADVVIEVLEEGGITRYLALFLESDSAKIGPVRSTRPYFVDLRNEFDAILVHCGQSKQAFHKIVAEDTPVINEMWTREAFWRSRERKTPHNLFTSTLKVREIVEAKGWEKSKPQWLYAFVDSTPTPIASPGPGDKANLYFRYLQQNQISYRWDPRTDLYLRYMNHEPQRDANTGAQIAVRNVVFQFVEDHVIDKKLRLELDLVGSGKLWLFRNGTLLEGRWEKKGRYEATHYYGPDGRFLALAPGKTWIQLLPPDKEIAFTVREEPKTAAAIRPESSSGGAGASAEAPHP